MTDEQKCFISPQSGDVWSIAGFFKSKRRMIIVDKYLKNKLIISVVDSADSDSDDVINSKLKNIRILTDLRIIDKEEFKFIVLKNTTIEEGFAATVQPLFLKDLVDKFKQEI